MKLERAQELYSDYREGLLSPAMMLAMEQHLESDPAANRDYEEFARVFDVLAAPNFDDVDAPHGFRAKVMERVALESAKNRHSSPGLFGGLRNLFGRPRALQAAAALGAVAAVAIVSGVMRGGQHHPAVSAGAISPLPIVNSTPIPVDPSQSVIAGVSTRIGDEGEVSQNFVLHLPKAFQTGVVDAFSVTSTQQIRDAAARVEAKSIVKDEPIGRNEDLSIPVVVYRGATPGSTLNVLFDLRLTTLDGRSITDDVVVFTPMNPTDSISASSIPPTNGKYFDSLQTLSSQYHVTIIADTAGAPDSAEAWSSTDGIETALARVVGSGNSVKVLSPGVYFVYHKQPSM